jgi:hypothetical protein
MFNAPRVLAIPIFVVALASVACQYDPFAHEFTTVEPTREELVGDYELNDETLNMLRRLGVQPPPQSHLMLQDDGRFSMSDLPTCWRLFEECSSATESVSGTWRIEQDDENGWWTIRFHLLEIEGQPGDFGTPAHLRGDRSPRLVHFTIGDPDMGQALAFQKDSGPFR